MEKLHNFKLIDGEFEPSDAKRILTTLVSSKIQFHSMESFAITERSSGDISFHQKRIKELAQTNVDIKKVMDYAAGNNLSLKINGNINIELINEQF